MKKNCINYILLTLGGIILLVIACSCKTAKVVERPIENTRLVHDTLMQYQHTLDTVQMRDSVFMYIKGDTIYHYRERERIRVQIKTDTIRTVLNDTIISTKVVSVPAELTKWEKFKQQTGGITITLIGGVLVVGVIWLLLKIRNKKL